VRHATRAELGSFTLSASGGDEVSGFAVLAWHLVAHWHVLLLLLFLARPPRSVAVGLLGWVGLSAVLLLRARLSGDFMVVTGLLERFEGTAVLPLAMLLGLGADRAIRMVPERRRAPFAIGIAAVWAVFAFARGRSDADASSDRTIEVFRDALAATISPAALYVGGLSEETFYGLPLGAHLRFPLQGNLPWYWDGVAAELEPRVRLFLPPPRGLGELLAAAGAAGLEVTTTEPGMLAAAGYEEHVRGLWLVGVPTITAAPGPDTVRAASALCPYVIELGPLPERSHGLSRPARALFARAFTAAAEYLETAPDAVSAQAARAVAAGILESTDSGLWRDGCVTLQRSLRSAAR
jgi:hypothetical protein